MAYNNTMKNLASQGRRGDTELAHVNPQEAALLRALGGSGTINPNTGLREYGHAWWHPQWLSDAWNKTVGNEGIAGMVGDVVDWAWEGVTGHDPGWSDTDSDFLGLGSWWNRWIRNPLAEGYIGYHPGDDDDYRTGQAAHSSLIDLLTGTKARHEELGDIRETGKRNLRDTLSAKFIPNKQKFDYVKGMQDVASKGKGVAPTSPRFAHQAGMRQGLHGIDKTYASDRYNLLSMANRSYQDMMNSMLSSDYKATVPSYQNLITEHAPWLLDKKTDIT